MFVQRKMKSTELSLIFSIFLLFLVEYSSARPVTDDNSLSFELLQLAAIFSIWFLLRIDNSLAWLTQDIRSKKNGSSTQITESTIENKILKGAVIPSDDRKIGEIIFDVLSKDPNHVAQIDAETGNKITFKDIKDRSIRLAVWMKKLGIKPNDIIVECTYNQENTNVPLFATFFVDAIFNAWKSRIDLDEAQKLMRLYTPKVIFSTEEAADTLLAAAKLANVDVKLVVFGKHSSLQSFSDVLSSQEKEEIDKFALVNEKSPEDVSLILLTSGSTGFPKGVMHSSKALSAIAKGDSYIDSSKPLKALWYTPTYGISGIRLILQTTVQKNVQIVDSSTYDEDHVLKIIEKHNVDTVRMPNSLVSSLAKSDSIKRYNLQSLKVIMMAGAKIDRHILERLQSNFPNVLIQHSYGSTEAGATVAARTPKYEHTDTVGFATPNVQIKFVDLNSHENLGPNEIGEMYIKSPALMIGYYKNPELTKKEIDTEGWYHTGDVGKYAENGEIFVLDRIKNLIKYKHYLIIPSEIESVLLSHPDIELAAVVSIPHKSDGNWPVAFVQKVSGSKVTEGDLVKLMSALEEYKQLRGGIYFLEKIPFNQTEKIAKDQLQKIAQDMANKNSS